MSKYEADPSQPGLVRCNGAQAYGNGHVVRKTHEALEEVAASMDTFADNYRSPADNTEFESGVRHAAAMVRDVAASPPAPARDPWVPVAEAPEEWQDGRELLMWNGRERWVDRWQYNGPGDQGYPISATHMILIPDPPKGDNP